MENELRRNKGENAVMQHLFLFPQCFPKHFFFVLGHCNVISIDKRFTDVELDYYF